jgi:hypothetical protein
MARLYNVPGTLLLSFCNALLKSWLHALVLPADAISDDDQ